MLWCRRGRGMRRTVVMTAVVVVLVVWAMISVSRSLYAGRALTKGQVVYRCTSSGCGGWADRQKGIVAAYLLADMLHRDFLLDVTFPCDLDLFLTPNKVNWKGNASMPFFFSKESRSFMDVDGQTAARAVLQASDLNSQFPYDVTEMTWNMEMVQFLRQHQQARHVTWLANRTVPEVYQHVLGRLFSLGPQQQRQLEVLRSSRPPNTRLVCAQVRLGSRNDSFPDVLNINTVDHFPVLAAFLARYNDSSRYRIYISSDSERIVEMTQRQFPQMVLTVPGPITHSDRTKSFDACAGFGKAIVEQHALATCDVLVISESGFGKIAAFLRGTDRDLFLFYNDKVEPFKRDGEFPNRKW